MSGFTGHNIYEPKNNPAAHRLWELVQPILVAKSAWETLVSAIGAGYAEAWEDQRDLLGEIKDKLQADQDRDAFLLSILTAGVAGGLLGAIVAKAFGNAEGLKLFLKDFASNAASNGGSQFGGSAWGYFQNKIDGSPFQSPGIHPEQYSLQMSTNVGLFFTGLLETVGDLIAQILSGKIPASEADLESAKWYKYFSTVSFVNELPSSADIQRHDFANEASLCLWIAWGAERDFGYWENAWKAALAGKSWPYEDILRWDPILDQIKKINPHLLAFATTATPGYLSNISHNGFGASFQSGAGQHLDVRRLRALGLFSDIESARAMSTYLVVPHMAMGATTARKALAQAFGGGSEYLRAGK